MSIRIPNLGPSSSGPSLQGVSIGDAIKPALALSNVAQGLRKAGDRLYEHDLKIMDAENSADLTEFKTNAKTAYANRQASFVDDHDHTKFKEKWDKDLEGLRKTLGDSGYSSSTLEKANLFLTGFEGDSRIGVAKAAQSKAVQRRDQAFKNGVAQIEQFYDPNNPGVAAAMFRDLLADQNLSPEAREAAQNQFNEFSKQRDTHAAISSDPKQWLEDNREPGANTVEWERNQRQAKVLLGQRSREQVDQIFDDIFDGKINDPKDIDAMGDILGGEAKRRLKDALFRRDDDDLRREMRDPEFQKQLKGEVSNLIDGYDPEGEAMDEDFVSILNKLELMTNGPLKQEFENQLKGIRDGKEKEIKTVSDWGYTQIKEHLDAGGFGKIEEEDPPARALGSYFDDGLLKDIDLLEDFGLKPETAEKISQLEEAGQRKEAVDLLRKSWNQGPRSEDFPGDKGAAFDAIRNHKGDTHMIIDPAMKAQSGLDASKSKAEAMRRYGNTISELANYLKLNPKATTEDVSRHLEAEKIDIGAGLTNGSWIPRPRSKRLDGVKMDPKAYLKRSDVPYNGIAANVRYNNPAAAYPRKADTKYGLMGYGVLNGGKQGMHKIGRFPTAVHGAAANFDLFASKYVGKTAYAAVRRWRGNGGRGEKTTVPKGYAPQMKITSSFLNDPTRAVDFFKKMALHESPSFKSLSDSDWRSAWEMWKANA